MLRANHCGTRPVHHNPQQARVLLLASIAGWDAVGNIDVSTLARQLIAAVTNVVGRAAGLVSGT